MNVCLTCVREHVVLSQVLQKVLHLVEEHTENVVRIVFHHKRRVNRVARLIMAKLEHGHEQLQPTLETGG